LHEKESGDVGFQNPDNRALEPGETEKRKGEYMPHHTQPCKLNV
jgi:hypothetical protein